MSRFESPATRGQVLLSEAARELFHAELALHDAHQSGVDAWIAAAADHLHRAVQGYLAQLRAADPTAA